MTTENISETARILMDKRREFLDGAINHLTSLKYELADIENLPKNADGTHWFFDSDALKHMENRLDMVEKTLDQFSKELTNC